MKVFQINTVSNWGATGRIVEGIGEKILECGGKVFIAYCRHNNESLLQTIKIGTNTDIYIHVLQTRLFDKHGLASKSATLRLIRRSRISLILCPSTDSTFQPQASYFMATFSVSTSSTLVESWMLFES